jgi:hypothetical protein
MYHELLSMTSKTKINTPDLHTGYYSFFLKGGIVTGNLKRIGADTVTIDSPIMGKIEMKTLEFLDSGFKKI